MADEPLRDSFFEKFFSRVPSDVAESFTPEQLNCIKMAFGSRSWGSHRVDIRRSIPLIGTRLYFVLLIGEELRNIDRRAAEKALRPLWTLPNIILMIAFLLVLGIAVSASMFSVYNFLGIDFMPGKEQQSRHEPPIASVKYAGPAWAAPASQATVLLPFNIDGKRA